jgi:hypothetical protein
LNVTRYVGGALGLAVISAIATNRSTYLMQEGNPAEIALNSGFRLGFAISAALMVVTALTAGLLFRDVGRGQKVDINEVTRAGIEG